MGVVAGALDFGARLSEAAVHVFGDVFPGDGLPETGPAGAGVEFRFRIEQFSIAEPVRAKRAVRKGKSATRLSPNPVKLKARADGSSSRAISNLLLFG